MPEIKRINLFAKQKKYVKVEKYFSWFRLCLIGVVGFFIAFSIFSFISLSQQQQKLKELDLASKQYLDFLIKNNEIEGKFIFYKNKNQEFNKIIANDVNFLPYYRVLNESLKTSTSSALLNSMTINKDRSVEFSILMENYDSALQFIKYAETDDFIKSFEDLTLIEFSSQLSSPGQKADNNMKRLITLTFHGKFKKLNEN